MILSNNNISLTGITTYNSADTDKIYLTSVGATGPRIAHASGWEFDFFAGSSASTTGNFAFNHGRAGGTFSESMRMTSNLQVGIGTTVPTARLDVSEADTLASVNMSTWSRKSLANAVIVRGYFTPLVGNTINWSNAGNTPNINLITWTPSNATLGGHFIIKKSGIWGITYRVTGSPAGTHYTWIDASSNNVANVPFNTAGSPIMAFSQGTISVLHVSYTGYLHAQTGTFYKVRYASGSLTTPVTLSHFQISLLYETPDLGTNFPFS